MTDAADARASATVTITVGPAGPAVTITSPAGDQTLFIGGSLDFAATGSGGQAPYSYAWDFDANGAGGGPPPSAVQNPTGVLYTTAGSYRARVTVTDALAATGSASLNVRVSDPGAPVLELEPIKDNSIYGESENSNGAGTSLFAGRTQPGNIRRALLAFDLSTLPAGAVVSSVTLTLTLQQTRDAGARTFTLHRLSENWGEGTSTGTGGGGAGGSPTTGDATWNFAFYNGTDWGVAGGAFEAVVSADWAIGKTTGPVSISTAGLAADVAFWRSNPGLNFGWLLRDGNDDGSSGTPANQTARRFGSRESTSATVRPLLRIEYTLP